MFLPPISLCPLKLERFFIDPCSPFSVALSFLPTRLAGTQSKLLSGVMEGHDEDPKQSTADMTAFVQNLLQQMQSRFQAMSDNIVTKIDEMGSRIDELEQSINELKAEMGECPPSPATATKTTNDEPPDGST